MSTKIQPTSAEVNVNRHLASSRYDHDEPDAFSGQDYWLQKIGRQELCHPVDRGFERELRRRLDWWEKLRREG